MASAWKEDLSKAVLVQGAKPKSQLKIKAMPHRNKLVAKAKPENTMSSQDRPTIKIKQPEGTYEFKFGIVWKSQMKVKGSKKNPMDPSVPMESVVEFTEARIFVESVKVPSMLHTCEVHAKLNRVKNCGTAKNMEPNAMFDIDIKTGSVTPGTKWADHLMCCDLHGWSNKVHNFK